jgi:predicted phosphodiesterase
MGAGRRDDLAENGNLLISLLENYYYAQGWYLVLNGDIEELQRHSLEHIEERWEKLIRIFDLFAAENRLYKLIGNHDEELLLKKSYRYPLFNVIRIDTGYIPVYVYHGHQASKIYHKYNKLIGAGIRYVLKPFGIKNISSGRSPYRRYRVEKAAYDFSLNNNCISVIGHTHRPLFESLGRFDYIKFEIERLCRDYPASSGEGRQRIEMEVFALKRELGKLKRKERRDVLRQSLYGDDLPVPCLFNSGCAISKKGLNAIELSGEDIALVYWFAEGQGKRFVSRGGYDIEKLPDSIYRRVVLNYEKLDYILARIKLLGLR